MNDSIQEFSHNTIVIAGTTQKPLNYSFKDRSKQSEVKKLLSEKYQIPVEKILHVTQRHTNNIVIVGSGDQDVSEIQADALITQQAQTCVGIYTADCLPLLLHDSATGTIAAVHLGRRGYQKGLLSKVLTTLKNDFNVSPSTLHSIIGPSIQYNDHIIRRDEIDLFPDSYRNQYITEREAGSSVVQNLELHKIFCDRHGLPYDIKPYSSALVDIPGMVIADLLSFGVNLRNIDHHSTNTFRSDLYHSYRADHPRNGHNFSFIMKL